MYYRRRAKVEDAGRGALGLQGGAISHIPTNGIHVSFKLSFGEKGKKEGNAAAIPHKSLVNPVTWLSMEQNCPWLIIS